MEITKTRFDGNTVSDPNSQLGSVLSFTGGPSKVEDCCFVANEFDISTVLSNSDADPRLAGNYGENNVRLRGDTGCNDVLLLPGSLSIVDSIRNDVTSSCLSFDATSCVLDQVTDPSPSSANRGIGGPSLHMYGTSLLLLVLLLR